MRTGEPLAVENATLDPRVKDNLAIRDLGVIGFLEMPIVLSTGETIGSLCAIEGKPRHWTEDEKEALRELSHLVTSEIDLRKLVQTQLDMMAIVSHDLKNPISGLLLSADLMERKIGSTCSLEEMKRISFPVLQRMRNSANRMNQLVHEVLDHARIESGPIALRMEEVSIAQLLSSAVEGSAWRAEQREVRIHVELASPDQEL